MTNPEICDEILSNAYEHAKTHHLAYAGAITPKEAWSLIQNYPNTILVDVRSQAELDWVGFVDLFDDRWVHIEWNLYPNNTRNPEFRELLEEAIDKNQTVLFLCRSGIRSHHAATFASEHGYKRSFNILQGFEGEKNTQGHRGKSSGWKHSNLPWLQN
jgi:rhodanese-related sulfurtransferase